MKTFRWMRWKRCAPMGMMWHGFVKTRGEAAMNKCLPALNKRGAF